MPIEFLPVEEKHLAELAAILNYYVIHSTATFHKAELTLEQMQEKVFFENPIYKAFLVRSADETIGYCAVTKWKIQEAYRHTGEINIYLKNGYSGKGIGKIAIGYLEEYARSKEITTLIAGACEENKHSISMFERQGFERCAYFKNTGYKFGRWLNMVYLQKSLK